MLLQRRPLMKKRKSKILQKNDPPVLHVEDLSPKKTAYGSLFIFIIPIKKNVLVSSMKNRINHEIHVIIVCECILNIEDEFEFRRKFFRESEA